MLQPRLLFRRKQPASVRVLGIIIAEGDLLVLRDDRIQGAPFTFPGGDYERGDTFQSRMEQVFSNTTNAFVAQTGYLFVVENRVLIGKQMIHTLEHYPTVQFDRQDVKAKIKGIGHYWLPLNKLNQFNLHPVFVRDIIFDHRETERSHWVVPIELPR